MYSTCSFWLHSLHVTCQMKEQKLTSGSGCVCKLIRYPKAEIIWKCTEFLCHMLYIYLSPWQRYFDLYKSVPMLFGTEFRQRMLSVWYTLKSLTPPNYQITHPLFHIFTSIMNIYFSLTSNIVVFIFIIYLFISIFSIANLR